MDFILAQKTSDVFPFLKNRNVPGMLEGRDCDSTSAVALYRNVGDKIGAVIGLFEKPVSNTKAKIGEILHEMGHQVSDMFHKSIGVPFTETEGFTEAYLKDIKNLPENMKKYGKRVKGAEYGINLLTLGSTPNQADKDGKAEAFAEIFAMLNKKSISEQYSKGMDKLIRKIFPNTVAYTEKLLYLLGKR